MTAKALISLTDLKGYLYPTTEAATQVSTKYDTLLQVVINAVSARIDGYVRDNGFTLTKGAVVEYRNGGRCSYWLRQPPIDTSLAYSVYVDDSLLTVNDDYKVDTTANKIILLSKASESEPLNVKLSYYGGYAELTAGTPAVGTGILDIPSDMKYAVIQQCAYLFKRREELGVQSISLPNGSISLSGEIDLLKYVKDSLSKYSRHVEEI
jgi:hypothetical protein